MSKIFVVGIGPGEYEQMTIRAVNALQSCDVIVGYTVYVDLVKEHFAEKEFLTTPMRREVERCRMAFEEAKKGRSVAMICSGDAGVYGMAGLMLEIGGPGRRRCAGRTADSRFLPDQSQRSFNPLGKN